NGFSQPLAKVVTWRPPKLALDLGEVDSVAKIVAGPIRDEGDQVCEFLDRSAEMFGHDGADLMDERQVVALAVAAHAVRFRVATLRGDPPDRFYVIVDVQPISNVLPLPVDRHRPALRRRQDHRRDHLLGILAWTVVVGAVGKPDR